jgi:hypothetical protein
MWLAVPDALQLLFSFCSSPFVSILLLTGVKIKVKKISLV